MTLAGLQFAYSKLLSATFIFSHINPDSWVYVNNDKTHQYQNKNIFVCMIILYQISGLRHSYSCMSVYFPGEYNMGRMSTYQKLFFWNPQNFSLLPPWCKNFHKAYGTPNLISLFNGKNIH